MPSNCLNSDGSDVISHDPISCLQAVLIQADIRWNFAWPYSLPSNGFDSVGSDETAILPIMKPSPILNNLASS